MIYLEPVTEGFVEVRTHPHSYIYPSFILINKAVMMQSDYDRLLNKYTKPGKKLCRLVVKEGKIWLDSGERK